MHGKTRIPALNCTVKSEALRQVGCQLYKCKDVHEAVAAALDGARPNTIIYMVKEYIDSLDNDAYNRFVAQVKRREGR